MPGKRACAARLLRKRRKEGVRTIGAGMNIEEARTPVILDEAGGINLFGVGYRQGCKPAGEAKAGCYCWNEMEAIREPSQRLSENAAGASSFSHGGEEFTALPSPLYADRYLEYLKMGRTSSFRTIPTCR